MYNNDWIYASLHNNDAPILSELNGSEIKLGWVSANSLSVEILNLKITNK